MEVKQANVWARDIAYYVRRHPPKPPVDLRRRIRHMTAGEEVDDNDVAQLERKVRWLLYGQPRVRENMRRRAAAELRQ